VPARAGERGRCPGGDGGAQDYRAEDVGAEDDGVREDREAGDDIDEREHARVFHASARTKPAATSSAAVSPWTPNALESFRRL
jgi:hypothetical protein